MEKILLIIHRKWQKKNYNRSDNKNKILIRYKLQKENTNTAGWICLIVNNVL